MKGKDILKHDLWNRICLEQDKSIWNVLVMISLIRYLYRIKQSVILFGLADYRMTGCCAHSTYTKCENRNEKTREVDSSSNFSLSFCSCRVWISARTSTVLNKIFRVFSKSFHSSPGTVPIIKSRPLSSHVFLIYYSFITQYSRL
jgi:hypothetical protein